MHSLTYVMKKTRENFKNNNQQSQIQEQWQFVPIPSARVRASTEPTQPKDHADKYIYSINKKRFMEKSIFLPSINRNGDSSRESPQRHSRWHSQGDESWQKSIDSQAETMQYLNQCDEIIENLKKLTNISSERIRKKKPYSTNSQYRNPRQFPKNRNIYHNGQILQNEYLNKQSQELKIIKQKIKQQSSPNLQAGISKQIKAKYLISKTNNLHSQKSNKNQDDLLQAKAQMELKKAERKHKFLLKFLNKAKDRGFELQKRILEHRKKSKEHGSNPQQKQKQKQSKKEQNQQKQKQITKQLKKQEKPKQDQGNKKQGVKK